MVRVGIVGSRSFSNLERVKDYVKSLDKDTIIVSTGNNSVDETEKSIKVKLGIHTTFLPKSRITFGKPYEGNKLKVKLPMWLYRKSFS